MAFLTRAFGRKIERRDMNNGLGYNPLESPTTPLALGWQFLMGGGHRSEAGEWVSERSSIQDATVFSCSRIIAESVSSLPLRLIKLDSAGRHIENQHQVARLLRQPNPESTWVTFIESQLLQLILGGNCAAQIQRNAAGQPVALWPLHWGQVSPARNSDGDLVYKVNVAKEGETPQYRVLPAADVLHVRLMGFDGVVGLSVIAAHRQTIGLSIAATKSAARLFRNGSVPSLVLKNTSALGMSPQDKTKAREDFETLMTASNQHRLMILDQDFTIEKMGYSAEESQWLQTRQLSVEQISGLFRVPSHMLSSTTRITNSNMQEQNALFISECLKSYMVRISAEYSAKLFFEAEKATYELDWDTSSLLMGDYASKAAYWTSAINGGWASRAEARHYFALNPVTDQALDQFIVPVNMQASSKLTESSPQSDPDTDTDADDLADFTEAVTRSSQGDNVVTTFGPIIERMAESRGLNLDVLPQILRSIERRSKRWGSAALEAGKTAADELERVTKALTIAVAEAKTKGQLCQA